jgi:hypothetical protein
MSWQATSCRPCLLERLEGDAVRARRDLLAAAAHTLSRTSPGPTDPDADAHEAAVVASLADITAARGVPDDGEGDDDFGGSDDFGAKGDAELAGVAAKLRDVHRGVVGRRLAAKALRLFAGAEAGKLLRTSNRLTLNDLNLLLLLFVFV